MKPFGSTRTVVHPNHAFIAPDGHITADLPGWTGAQGIVLISPHMRGLPRFSQYIAVMAAGAQSGPPLPGIQRFVFVLDGTVEAALDGSTTTLAAEDYLYVPADRPHTLSAQSAARLMIFEKPYVPSRITDAAPDPITGHARAGDGTPFMGDDEARLRVLLPTDQRYDMAVNLFTFQPGAALPFVETHIMEHGLYLVEGQGIYRLDDQWYPIQAGDAIWMGSYCP